MPILLQKDKPHRILLWFTCLCVVLLGVMSFVVPPGADPDPCWGFLVMHSMEQGNHFNLLITPDPGNIAINQSQFLSWWSPGQYLFPYLFKTLLNIDTGHAVSLTVTICSLLGLAGFYQLFKQLGFTKWVAAISTAFIASQLFFILPFVYYTGGEVLLFAFMGWFLYGCFYFKKITWQVLVLVFLASLVGFFSKSSVLWMYAAGVACTWISVSANATSGLQIEISNNLAGLPNTKKRIKIWAVNGILLVIPFICAVVIIYIFYLSKGAYPTTGQEGFLIRPETFSFPLASPILSSFSVDELIDGLIYQPDGPKVSYHLAVFILVILALCSLIFMIFLIRRLPKDYLIATLTFYVFGVVFFSYMFLNQASISYEGRHFRIIGLLFIPGFIYLLFKTKVGRALFFVIWIIVAYKGFIFFNGEFKANRQASRGNSGISQQVYDQATLNEIIKIDQHHHNDAIFVVMSSDIAAEISNNRVITIDVESIEGNDFSKLRYSGKGGPIYILIPREYVKNGKEPGIIKSFTGYHNFVFKQLSRNYYLYFASS